MNRLDWISVKDKLPPMQKDSTYSDRVVVTDGKSISSAMYNGKGWELSDSWWQPITFDDINLNRITHWLTLKDLVSTIPII